MGDHEHEAWDDLLFGRGEDEDGYYADSLSYRRHPGKYTTRTPYIPGQPRYMMGPGGVNRFEDVHQQNDYFAEEHLQPEFQQLIVSQLHGQTPKSYCVSGVIHFTTPYRGLQEFSFLADWLPKKCCIFTGETIRVPQWLVFARWRERKKRRAVIDIKIPF